MIRKVEICGVNTSKLPVLSNEEKTERVNQLLDIVKILNREIRGREENLSPVFVIGGMYDINSPFFLGRIKLNGKNGEFSIDTEMLKDTTTLTIGDKSIYDDTKVGILKNTFKNEKEIESRNVRGIVRKIKDYITFLKNNENYETVIHDIGHRIAVSKKKER